MSCSVEVHAHICVCSAVVAGCVRVHVAPTTLTLTTPARVLAIPAPPRTLFRPQSAVISQGANTAIRVSLQPLDDTTEHRSTQLSLSPFLTFFLYVCSLPPCIFLSAW
eukprot:m.136225 g.136225  ORF g.136225 m.136225 type:complete len:108 (-) comp52470_c0_seq4:1363-1686(-)